MMSSTKPIPLPSDSLSASSAFILAPLLLRPSKSAPVALSSRTRSWRACTQNLPPDSPTVLVNSWAQTRSIPFILDLSHTYVNILFLSNHCRRAAYAERQFMKTAEQFSISRKVLVLSAGLSSAAGDVLPWKIISAARQRDIDLSNERPCASFSISDLDYYDYIVVLDREVKDRLLRIAEATAHSSGAHLYEWERKIRLFCDFEGCITPRHHSTGRPLDVPSFGGSFQYDAVMDLIQDGCHSIARSLVTAGL